MYLTVAKCLTAVSTKTFSEKNHPSWFDWSFIVLYTSLNERSLKLSMGLTLSFEIISSSIRILLTRITVSIPNPKSNEFLRFRFTPRSKWYSKYVNRSSIDVLTVYALCPFYYFPAAVCLEEISLNEPKQTTLCRRHTHTRLSSSNSSSGMPVWTGWLPSQALTNQRAAHMHTRFRHAVVWLMLYVLGVTIVTSI